MKNKFKASIELANDLEHAHYSGARRFFQEFGEEDEESIKKKLERVEDRYEVIIAGLTKAITTTGMSKSNAKIKQKELDDFSKEKFMSLIELAKKDHYDNFGVTKVASWERA
jgi:hypothetical protein